jgi:hypothetical protein
VCSEVGERRIAEVNGTGPLFWKITPGDDYPRQLKDANRELRELTGLKDIRPHALRRIGRPHVSALGVRDEVASPEPTTSIPIGRRERTRSGSGTRSWRHFRPVKSNGPPRDREGAALRAPRAAAVDACAGREAKYPVGGIPRPAAAALGRCASQRVRARGRRRAPDERADPHGRR